MSDISGEICIANQCNKCCDGGAVGTRVWLSQTEYTYLNGRGTRLVKDTDEHSSNLGKPVPIKDVTGRFSCTRYGLCSENDSENGLCRSYGRIRICNQTLPGSEGCSSCRADFGLPPISS